MTVLRYKSAKYSIERPLHIGAALAGADADQLEPTLTPFGLPLGEAFQLRDDLLGVFGDAGTTGKPAGDDLVEGKRTVLVALALDAAAADEAADASTRRSARRSTTAAVAELREIIDDSGAHAQVEKVIEALADARARGPGRRHRRRRGARRAARARRGRHPAHRLTRRAALSRGWGRRPRRGRRRAAARRTARPGRR